MADAPTTVAQRAPGSVAAPRRRSLWALFWPESGAISPIPALDGLRAMAVILVILFHSWSDIPDGGNFVISAENPNPLNSARTGVQLFFVLSGFLLFLPYARWLFGVRGRPSTLLFYRRRVLRVGPAYWVSLVVLIALAGVYTLPVFADALFHVVFLFNFSGKTVSAFNTVFWTLAVEFQFYLLLPLLGWLVYAVARRIGPLVATIVLVGGLGAVSLAGEALDQFNGGAHLLRFDTTGLIGTFSLSSWIGVFAAGMGCSVLYIYLTEVARLSAEARGRLRMLGTVAFCVGAGTALAIAVLPQWHLIKGKFLIFGWAYAGCLLGVLFGAPIFSRALASRPLRFIGLISYSVYLWHSIVLQRLEPHLPAFGDPRTHVLVRFVLGLVLSLAVAYGSYQCFERPFIHARKAAHEPMPAARAS
jgi:peptidoglycan/LPS O-acetylase OafA/YrhL